MADQEVAAATTTTVLTTGFLGGVGWAARRLWVLFSTMSKETRTTREKVLRFEERIGHMESRLDSERAERDYKHSLLANEIGALRKEQAEQTKVLYEIKGTLDARRSSGPVTP